MRVVSGRIGLLLVAAAALGIGSCRTSRTEVKVERTVSVAATEMWSAATRIELPAGSTFSLEVDPARTWTSGRWTGNADGGEPPGGDFLLPRAPAYALIGRFGPEGEPFLLGLRYEDSVDERSTLELTMNDVPGLYWDNRSELPVKVTILNRR